MKQRSSVDLPLMQHIQRHHKPIYDNLYKRIQSAVKKFLQVSKANNGFTELTILASNWSVQYIAILYYMYMYVHVYVLHCVLLLVHTIYIHVYSYVGGKELEEHKKSKWSFNMMLFIVIFEELFIKVNTMHRFHAHTKSITYLETKLTTACIKNKRGSLFLHGIRLYEDYTVVY